MKRAILAALLIGAAFAAIVGPGAAFHLLPPDVTGEAARLAEVLQIAPGTVVADVGAGTGRLTISLARRVGPSGRVYATERNADLRVAIQERSAREGVSNVTVVEGEATRTGLPEGCCDAAVMRDVYHHLTDPERFNLSLGEALRPGARLVIIDFEPGTFWHLPAMPAGVPSTRAGHGVETQVVADELGRAGFRVERIDDDWGGWTYMILLRAPSGRGPVT
jgi:ubiquinone/menaquinone biosynthesis C-methylase UbiE